MSTPRVKDNDRDEIEALREYAREATKAITSLTVGGSEFFGRKIGDIYTADLPFCVNQIKERETRAHQRWIDAWSELLALRSKMLGAPDRRHFEILADAMAEVKATSDGLSDQPIADIVQGCIDEIAALSQASE